jgi:DNA-binding MarR family transcriptional regulator
MRQQDPDKPLPVLPPHRVAAHLARRFNQICVGVTVELLAGEELTPMVYGLMSVIDAEPGRGQGHLARRFGVDAVSIGQMIDFLEQRRLAERKLDPEDRRAHRVFLTQRGVALHRKLRPAMLAAQDRILAPLTKGERAALLDMLTRAIEANETYARPGNGRRKPRRKSVSSPGKE